MRIGDMFPTILLLVLTAIVLGVGLLVLNQFMSQSSVSGTVAETAINDSMYAIADFPDWLPTIVTVVAAAIILSLVMTGFGREGRF